MMERGRVSNASSIRRKGSFLRGRVVDRWE
jgi:hypothetical protein